MKNLFALLFAVPLLALAQAPEAPATGLFNLVSLTAQAEREVANDLLGATLAAEAEGNDPAQLSADVNRRMQAALATAKGYGAVQARSGNYQTFPVYDNNSRISRWRVRQELRLESANFAAATELIGKLQGSPQSALTVAGMALSVSADARKQAENALIPEALAAFDERARLVRDAMKAKSFRMRNLQISGGGAPSPVPMAARAMAMSSGPAPAVEAGTTRILITVSGTVQLQ
jgi:predicted secreted protein